MGKLNGKVAIVTGASRGIGKGIAQLFAAEGAKVVCVARTAKEGDHFLEGSLETTVAQIKAAGGTAVAVQADISREENCDLVVQSTHQAFGQVDVLINNAAVTFFIPIKDMPVKRWIVAFNVNVNAPFMLTQKVLPDMTARKSGAIVNISSRSAIGPGRGPYKPEQDSAVSDTMYGATKAAIERFSQGLAKELYSYGISVACISPGVGVATPGTVYHKLASSLNDPKREPMEMMTKAILLLATEPLDKVTGRVTYSQAILKEFGWIKEGKGVGLTVRGTGYSEI